MSFSRFTSSLFILCLAFSLQTAIAFDPLSYICSSTAGNFTNYTPYEANLYKLLGSLYFQTPPTGFGEGSVGQAQDQVNGLALCRGDVSSIDCKVCVVEASSEILKRCPNNKEAIIWYDNCLLKYSNTNFFGKIDFQNKFYMWNVQNVSDPESFNQKTKALLSQLAEQAYVSPKLYANGDSELEASKKLYGLVQCTRDLSSVDCKKCLDGAISEIPNCCYGKIGGRVVGGSCSIIYEMHPFVKS